VTGGRITAWAALSALAAAAGCAEVERVLDPYPAPALTSPFGFERVAVAPFADLTGEVAPECKSMIAKAAEIYHAELQRVEGLRVVPPAVVRKAVESSGLKMTSPVEALELARLLGADAIVVGAVTSYDPYYKPRVGLAVEVYQRVPAPKAAEDILALAERGRPFAIRTGGAVPVAVVDHVYDSADHETDRAVRRFGRQRDALSSAFGTERFLRDMEKYLSFVCHRAIVEMLAAERGRQEAERERAEPAPR